jgi:hypothetical protein
VHSTTGRLLVDLTKSLPLGLAYILATDVPPLELVSWQRGPSAIGMADARTGLAPGLVRASLVLLAQL